MKKFFRVFIPILLTIAILFSACWYFLAYDRDFTRDMLVSFARVLDDHGKRSASNWLYDVAYRYAQNDDSIAIELARQYREHGNYTKAEYTLSSAISDGASVELYIALCQTYVEQDKLLDAISMLDNVADPKIKAQLDSLRPSAPIPDHPKGVYNRYISITLSSPGNQVFCTLGDEYPIMSAGALTHPLALENGTTTVRTVSLSESGLVSPMAVYTYTIENVIEGITLTDPAVDRAVREYLMVGADHPLYSNELWAIDSFILPEDAQSLTDLALMPNLKTLVIRGGKFESLMPLANLLSIEELIIADTPISYEDVEAFATMTQLKSLTLSGCGLSGIDPLANLTKLTYLDLHKNTIRDLTAIASMPDLAYLDLSHNAVVSLEKLSGLSKLTELNLSYNSIQSASPLSGCSSLLVLNLNHNQISSLDGINKLTGLRSLFVAFNKLTGVSQLSSCTKLGDLDISNNSISSISNLATLPDLFSLNFSYNKVSKLPSFAKESKLFIIKGSSNKLTSLDALAELKMLNQVIMDQNSGIKSISKLSTCPAIKEISVFGTAVKDISAFNGMDVLIKYNPI